MMYREDYEHAARIVEDEMFPEPETQQQDIWNMALKIAARSIRRAGQSAEWQPMAMGEGK